MNILPLIIEKPLATIKKEGCLILKDLNLAISTFKLILNCLQYNFGGI